MAFSVEITGPALLDAEEFVLFIRDEKHEPDAAERWFRGLIEAIGTLAEFPSRCPVIPEADQFAEELRHLIYFSHRIIFGVDDEAQRVVVYRVYHGARKRLQVDNLAW